jgi:ribosomal protein L19E
MDKYLIKSTNVYRVPTVEDALKLRDELQNTENGELTNFSYTTKYIKAKGEIIEEYQLVKTCIEFTSEKDPELHIQAKYEMEY